jgi:simple sugar transport system substrate-binding protein/basic membrane protein A
MEHSEDVRTLLVAVLGLSLLAVGCSRSDDPGGGPTVVGFLLVGESDDLGYNQAIWEGSLVLARAFPEVRVVRRTQVPETEAAGQAMEDLIAEGATIVFATSFGYRDQAYQVAARHPDVVVLQQGNVEGTPGLPNFGTYWGAVYEPVYAAGIVAGAATRTGRLGFVAAFPVTPVFNNVNAFLLGARSVRPDATVHVALTGSWCDPEQQLAAARRLLAARVDVLTQHQDCTRTVLEEAERAHVASVGYHADGSEAAPRGYLVGAVWSWGDTLVDILRTIRHGTFTGSRYDGDYRGGLAHGDNPFVLSELSDLVSPGTRAAVSRAEERMRAGWSPFTGPLADRHGTVRVQAGQVPTQAEVDRMDYLLEGVVGALAGSPA